MHIYLVLLCLLSVMRVTQGYSQFPCADRNGPRYCAKAKQCRQCVAMMCMTEKNRDLFKLMCCDSDAARHLHECNGLCENSGSTTLIRYDADKKERALLCPADQIIFKCKSCRPCSEMMCLKDVLREVFIQQCFPKLNYDQLKSSDCKDLAHKYNKSTLSMVTDDLKPSSPAKISGITTSSAVDSYKPETSSSSNPLKTPATDAFSTTTSSYPTTTSAYQTTTPAYQTTFEHFYNGLFVTLGVISALIGTCFSLDGFILCDRKYNRSGISHWCLSHCKLPDKREEKNKEEQELLLSEIEKTKDGLQIDITALHTKFDEMVISTDKSTKQLESTIETLVKSLRKELHLAQEEQKQDHLKHNQAQTQQMGILQKELRFSQKIFKNQTAKQLESTIDNLQKELHSSLEEMEKNILRDDIAQKQKVETLYSELRSAQNNFKDETAKQLESTIENFAQLKQTLQKELHSSLEEMKKNILRHDIAQKQVETLYSELRSSQVNSNNSTKQLEKQIMTIVEQQKVLRFYMMEIVQKCEGTKGPNCDNLHQNLENAEAQQHYLINTVRNRNRGQFINEPSGPQESKPNAHQ